MSFWVYILTNRSKRPFYTGVTRSLENRTFDHKHGIGSAFTTKYKLDRLVYFEEWRDPLSAIEREKQIKGWTRIRKMQLVVSINPEWRDLSEEWFVRHRYQPDARAVQPEPPAANSCPHPAVPAPPEKCIGPSAKRRPQDDPEEDSR